MTSEEALAGTIGVPVEIKKIKIKSFDINYVMAGQGEPVLLLHGGNIGWGQWYPNIEPLAKHFTVYALDIPGAGRSSQVNYKNLDLTKDVVEVVELFIAQLGIKSVRIIGSSIGGWTALQIAIRHPELVKKIVVADCIGFMNYMRFADRVIGIPAFAKFLSKTILKPVRENKNIEKFLRDVFFNKSFLFPKEFIDYFYDTMARSHNLLFISRLSSFWGMRPELVLHDSLHKIKIPVLILWGERDVLMPLKENQNNFSLIPHAKVKIFAGAGHIPSIESSEEFNKNTITFLTE